MTEPHTSASFHPLKTGARPTLVGGGGRKSPGFLQSPTSKTHTTVKCFTEPLMKTESTFSIFKCITS